MPSISIILPVYNGQTFITDSVNSVLQQKYTDFEFLIIDDCSTDGSWEYLNSLNDNRISLFRNEKNKGLFYNLNYLIKKSTSPIIKIWSQDDIMYENCIEEVITFHKKYPSIGFSYSNRDYIDSKGALIEINKIDNTPEIVSPELHTKIAFITGSIAGNIANVAINKMVLDSVGGFNEKMKISGDFDMWVRLAMNHSVGFIHKKLVQLRNHNGQLSGQEKYFIYHLKEDIEVYTFLLSNVPKSIATEGRATLRKGKLLFYYTLMLKAVLKGKLITAFKFLILLNKFDSFLLLTWYYFQIRVLSINSKK